MSVKNNKKRLLVDMKCNVQHPVFGILIFISFGFALVAFPYNIKNINYLIFGNKFISVKSKVEEIRKVHSEWSFSFYAVINQNEREYLLDLDFYFQNKIKAGDTVDLYFNKDGFNSLLVGRNLAFAGGDRYDLNHSFFNLFVSILLSLPFVLMSAIVINHYKIKPFK